MSPFAQSPTLWEGVLGIMASREFSARGASYDRRPLIKRANRLGGPAMRLMHWDRLRELGRIPRYDEGHSVNALRGIETYGAENVEIFMVSHRWLRPSIDPARSHPDSADAKKARAINEFSAWRRQWVLAQHGFLPEIYYWIDFSCIDQDNIPAAAPLLPLWAACCERFLRIETADYDERAWCRLEALLSYVYSFADHHTAIGVDFRSRWPHTGERTSRAILDPGAGRLTNPDDMALIAPLIDAATRAQPANRDRFAVRLNETAVTCYRL